MMVKRKPRFSVEQVRVSSIGGKTLSWTINDVTKDGGTKTQLPLPTLNLKFLKKVKIHSSYKSRLIYAYVLACASNMHGVDFLLC